MHLYNTRANKPLLDYQSSRPTYSVQIDFDEASREWNRNKKRVGQSYVYICGKTCKNGNSCKRTPKGDSRYCSVHQ